jgi:hypothetical protein
VKENVLGNEHSAVSVYQGKKNPDTDGHRALLKQKTMERKEYTVGTEGGDASIRDNGAEHRAEHF